MPRYFYLFVSLRSLAAARREYLLSSSCSPRRRSFSEYYLNIDDWECYQQLGNSDLDDNLLSHPGNESTKELQNISR